jgi:hypothetical protein
MLGEAKMMRRGKGKAIPTTAEAKKLLLAWRPRLNWRIFNEIFPDFLQY